VPGSGSYSLTFYDKAIFLIGRESLEAKDMLFGVTKGGKPRMFQQLSDRYKTPVVNVKMHGLGFVAKGLREGPGKAFIESSPKDRICYG